MREFIPHMCQSQLYIIEDAIPKDGVVLEWGSGYSTKYWLEHTQLSKLYAIEHNLQWRNTTREICGDDPRLDLVYFDIGPAEVELDESLEHLQPYATLKGVPVDEADVIIVDGFARNACCATAALRAKKGARLFLHDTDSHLYRWAIDHFEAHPDWHFIGEHIPLPEDLFAMEMSSWVRIN